MSGWKRAAVGAFMGACVLAGVVSPAAAAPDVPVADRARPRRLLIISLPDVVWDNLGIGPMPNLNPLLDDSAIADLTTRAVRRSTKLGDGYLTISAGTRAIGDGVTDGNGYEVGEPFGRDSAGEVFQQRTGRTVTHGLVQLDLASILDKNGALLFDAKIGALGDALAAAKYSRAVIGNGDGDDPDTLTTGAPTRRRYAVNALMGSAGTVPAGSVGPALLQRDTNAPFGQRFDIQQVEQSFQAVWKPRSVVLVEASDLVRADVYRVKATPARRNAQLRQALQRTDELVGRLLRHVDLERDVVMVIGPANPKRAVGLTVAGLHAPGLSPGLLRSATTRRSGFVQLVDVAPTVLAQLGIDRPQSMEGRPFERGATGGSAADRRSFLIAANRAAVFRDERVGEAAAVFVVAQLALLVLTAWALLRRTTTRARWRLAWFAVAVLGFVPAIYLARLLPFYRYGTVAYWTFVVLVSTVLAGLWMRVGRRNPLDALLGALGLTIAVLIGDVLAGAPLQLNSAFGYSPTVAGRFAGYGNLAFSSLAASAVLLAALVAHRVGGRRGAWCGIAVLAIAMVADAMPFWGGDVGGVLSMVPTFAIMAWLLLGFRVRVRTAVAAAAAAIVALVALGLLDLSRPADERTHLGRLFEQLGGGGEANVSTTIHRKLAANMGTLFTSVWAWTVPIAVVVLIFMAYLMHRAPGRVVAVKAAIPEWRAACIGLAVLAVLGFGLNDSGIAVPGVMLGVFLPVLVYVLVRVPDAEAPVDDDVATTRAPQLPVPTP